jgi:flagellar hook-associated protein 2
MSVTIGGTFSGLNVSSIIQSIIAADSIPITNLQTEDTTLTGTSSTLGALGTSLGTLSTQLQALTPSLLSSQVATVSNTSVGSAAVNSTAPATPGTINLDVTQVATPTVLTGGSSSGAFADTKLTAPPAGDTPIGTVLDESSIDGEFFTINGKQITFSSSDVLDDGNPNSTSSVIGLINNSGAGVTATYDSTTGTISLSSSSSILLGSSADTSDFLQQAQLFNNGTDSVTSSVGLGRIDPTVDLATAGLRTPLTAGTFTINGVSITYNSGDSLNTLISDINSSSAGVTAAYDAYEDQMVLTSTQSGPQNITVADGTGNIATALRLGSNDSQLQVGQPTLFTVGDSTTVRQTESNVIDSTALGAPGVTFTATGTGTTQITVAADVTTIAAALNAFVAQYNTTQELVSTDTAENTSGTTSTSDTAQGGPLATDMNFTFLAPQLRQVASGEVNSTATIRMLSDLGIDTNANDNTLTEVNTTDLQNALTNNLSEVISLFDDPTVGLTNTVQNVISSYNDSLNGVIVDEQNNIQQQITFNQDQITQMQAQIVAEQTNLENQFAALDSVEGDNQALSGILNGSSGTSSSTGSSSSSSSSSPSTFGSVGSSS